MREALAASGELPTEDSTFAETARYRGLTRGHTVTINTDTGGFNNDGYTRDSQVVG